MPNAAFLAYIPVVHQGYLDFFQRHPEITALILLDESTVHNYRPLVKDLRALSPQHIKTIIEALNLFERVEIFTADDLSNWSSQAPTIVAPDEDITRQVVEQYLSTAQVEYDTIFLRWDAQRSSQPTDPQPDAVISHEQLDRELMARAGAQAEHSSDWWRQVGAVLVKDGRILFEARNRHVPQDLQHYSDGDPRANFTKKVNIELSTAIHAESQIIAEAAKQGVSVAGASIYCTTFPCPVCAKLVAQSGISKCYYQGGYSMVDGEQVMKAAGVELIRVE